MSIEEEDVTVILGGIVVGTHCRKDVDSGCPKPSATMVDVLSARLQDAFEWSQSKLMSSKNDEPVSNQKSSVYTKNAFDSRKRQQFDKDLSRETNLYKIKEDPSKITPVNPISRTSVTSSCSCSTPINKESGSSTQRRLNVVNILNYGRVHDENTGYFARAFCDIVQAYRMHKYEYKEVSKEVIHDERLTKAVEQVSKETLSRYEEKHDEDENVEVPTYSSIYAADFARAKSIIENMRSAISDALLRFTSWTLFKLLPYFLTSIAACPTQINMLKKASDSGLPLIFIPLHRSHLDYILVTFILYNNNIRSPLVAAGDNLKIPVFGSLLRGLGAFYIKRRLEATGSEKDVIYRAALHTYMINCLRAKHNIEFFIEGGRSRTGKPLLPKVGILSVIVDAYLDGTINDALLVPVSMNYDKIVDGNFVHEQSGMPKQMESFSVAVKSIWKILNSHYGNLRIDFNQPFSIKELIKTFQQSPSKLSPSPMIKSSSIGSFNGENDVSISKLSMERCLSSRQSCSSLYGTDVVVEEQRGIVETIARHIVYDSTDATAIMSTNAISYLLLTKFRNGCTLKTLIDEFARFTDELLLNNKDVGYTGEPVDVVNHGIKLLGPELISTETVNGIVYVIPLLSLPNVIELTYYSNSVLSYYAVQSIIVTALESLSRNSSTVKHDKLLEASLQLCEVMSQEFILCKPCQKLESIISDGIDQLISNDIIRSCGDLNHAWSRNYRNADLDDDYYVPYEMEYEIVDGKKSNIRRWQLQTALRPLVENYCLTVECLPKILQEESGLSETDYIQEVRVRLNDLLETGKCIYGEAMSMDAIKNCVRLLKQWGIIETRSQGRNRILSISKGYRKEAHLTRIHSMFTAFKTDIPQNAYPER